MSGFYVTSPPIKCGDLDYSATVSFLRKTLLHDTSYYCTTFATIKHAISCSKGSFEILNKERLTFD